MARACSRLGSISWASLRIDLALPFLFQNTDLFEMIEKMQVRTGQGASELAGLKVAIPCLPPLCELIQGPSSHPFLGPQQVIPTCTYQASSSESWEAPVQ